MAQRKDSVSRTEIELLLAPTDTKMAKILEEAVELIKKYPGIIERIKEDLKLDAKKSKLPRLLDRCWEEDQTLPLPLEEILASGRDDLVAFDLELKVGRPRLKAEVVYVFLALRGCYGSVCGESSWDRFADSMTLRYYLEPYMNRLPGRTTVLENLNAVSEETRGFIVDCQLAHILDIGLDDFSRQTIDSTSVHGNSAWPTDMHLIVNFLNDAYRLGQRLDRFELLNFHQWHVPRWLEELDALEFKVNLTSKKKGGRQFKKFYGRFVTKAKQILDYLDKEYERFDDLVIGVNLMPSRRASLTGLWNRLEGDLMDGYILLDFTTERVLGSGETSREEYEDIYSASDRSARFIKKGGRETEFGYKIQLGRSANGFISSVLVPEGNATDSGQLLPMVEEHINRTKVIPDLVSTDDGYSSAEGRSNVLNLGVKDVSISGSKGKKITPEKDWLSEMYSQARNDRSAVESLMFTGKHCFEFGQFHRRGIASVRAEMLEKVIAYNFWRISYERTRRAEESTASRRRAA